MSYQHFSPPLRLQTQVPSFLPVLLRWSWIVLLIAASLQCLLFASFANIVAVASVVLAWALLSTTFLQAHMLRQYPFSSFLIIGFTATQFYLPLVFTLLEGNPLVFNLGLPYQVFFHSAAALLTLSAAHLCYRQVSAPLANRIPVVLQKLHFFSPPTELQLWLMGLLGLGATFYVYLYTGSALQSTGAASDKLLEALVPFSYAPFFIPFSRMYGAPEVPTKKVLTPLLAYTILLFVVSIGRNSRGAFMLGFTSVGFAYILGLLLNYYKTRLFSIKNFCWGLVVLWLFTGPLADIGTAMIIVRQQRTDIPYSELIGLTLETFSDKEAIRLRRLEDFTEKRDWDESYLNNLFIARFSNLKFNDNSLLLASHISDDDPDVLNFTVDHFLVTLPLPVLEALDINIDKKAFQVSYGDYLFAKVTANPWVLGSYLTGHFAGSGMAAFGWWYLLVLGVGIIPVYLLYDVLILKVRNFTTAVNFTCSPPIRFSFCGLLALTSVFQFLPAESVEAIAGFLLRGWAQMMLLYFLMFHLTKWVTTVAASLGPRATPSPRRFYSALKSK